MPLIKRYPNRKLYDTEGKQYVTLADVAAMIRRGEAVQVLEHPTGNDLTNLILSQIIFEQEKQRGDFLPQSLLTGLVRAGGQTWTSLRRTVVASLDAFAEVDEAIVSRVEQLVQQGDVALDEAERMLDNLLTAPASALEDRLQAAMSRRGVPSRSAFNELAAHLDDLHAQVEALSAQDETPENGDLFQSQITRMDE